MGLADGEVLVDDRLIYTANDLKVGLFQILPLSDNIQQRLKGRAPAMRRLLLKRQCQAVSTLSSMASRQPPSHHER